LPEQTVRHGETPRLYSYQPRILANDAGLAFGEMARMYADDEIDLDEIARIMNVAGDIARTMEDDARSVLDVMREQGEIDDEMHRRLQSAIEGAGGDYVMSTRERTDESVGEGEFVEDYTSGRPD
jgi:hypothetical protein